MKKTTNKYFQPTPKGWRIAGDMALLLIPAVHIALKDAPGISEGVKYWAMIGCDLVLISVKYLTNLKTK